MDNRDALISQLAESVGLHNPVNTRYEGSYYDASTGTLYCKGMALSKPLAEMAIKHFEILENRYDMSDPESRDIAMMYRCAIEAIKMMQDPDIISLMKEKAADHKIS